MNDSQSPIRLLRKMSLPAASAAPARPALRRASRLMPLEQRFMFDAAAVVTAAEAVHAKPEAVHVLVPDIAVPTQVRDADAARDNGRKEVVFIDTSIAGYKTLEAGVPDGFAIVEIDGSRDGLAQMAKWAETHTGYDAIHILSHAVEGKLELGTTLITDSSLSNAQVQAEWAAVGHALNAGGDLMVYGCDLAKGTDGDLFIHDLAAATGADVAASTDLTGAASKDANWILEKQVGDIETSAFSVDEFNNTLGNIVTGNDPGASNTDTNTISTTSGLFDIGQSFTATKTGLLTTLTLYASFESGATGTLNIYSGDGTGGTLLGSQSLSSFNDVGTLDTGNNRYIGTDITLSTPVNITNGNVYTFQITTTNFLSLTYTNQTNYAGGTLYQDGSDQGSSYDLEFSVTQADANAAPNNTVAPAISGTQTVGNALSTTTGTWNDPDSDPLTYSYQWYRADDSSGTNATAIGSATSSSYTLTTSDAHKYVRVVVTADDGNSHTPTANSAWTAVNDSAPANSVVPALSGTTTVGNSLSATTGTWSDADGDTVTYTYQWYRADDSSGTNATAIGSATASSYTLTSSDGDHYVRAVVTANDSHGSSNQTAASSWTAIHTVPSVSSIVRAGGASSTVDTGATSVQYTVTFSESVTGVDATDFTLTMTGTSFGNIASVSGSGTTYTVTVDTLSGDGILRLDLNGSGTGIKSGSSIDIAGGYTSGSTYALDHTAPNAPSTPDMTSGTDTGSSNSDNLTNNTTPTFSGTAEAGSTVKLYDTDGTTVLGTTTAAGGSWSITSSALSSGSHTLTARAIDAAGNVSSASSGLTADIDASAPTGLGLSATTIASQDTASASTIATLSATDSHAITYSLATGNGTNDADNGSFTISGNSLKVGASSLTAGTYKIYVAATDTAGNVTNQAFTITIVDAPNVSSVVRTGGASSTVNTSTTSVQYTVTFSESVTGVDATDFALTMTGTASGSIASVSGSGTTYTVTVDTLSGDGTMRLDLNGSGTGIQNGSSIDIAAGYTSGSTYTLDHTAPNAPSTPDMTSGTDSGSSNSDNITSNTTPTFTGTAESGSAVTLYDTDGTTVLGTATAAGGSWSITSSALSSGSHTLTAKATDAAGNVSSASSGLTMTIDNTASTASSVSVPSNGSYKTGQTLSFTVNTDEAVTVDTSGGTPRIALTVGSSTVYADYASGSGSSALVFTYTVQAGDTDVDGITVGALQSNGGTLKDAAGNSMTLTLNSVGSTSNVLIDTTAPDVNSVSVPTDGTYYTGQNLDFTVNFSEAVTVDTTGGTPRIALTLDTGGTAYADYMSGSGTGALVFRYAVVGGVMDQTGITVGALQNNGGTLKDAAGNDATLTLNSVGSTAAVDVDGSQPQVTDVSSTTADGSYNAGDTISVTVTFDRAVTVDTTGGTPTLALGDGGVATYSGGSGTSTLVFTYTVAGGENAADLDYASTSALALNGGTIRDSGGANVDALLTLASPGAANSLGANKDIVIDNTPPSIIFSGLAFSNDNGASHTDFITDAASQTITANLSGAPAAGDTVYGSLDNGATWTDITGKVSGTTLTWDNVTLTGSGTLKLKVTDSTGNDGTVKSQAYTLASASPSVLFNNLALSDDTGASHTDFITRTANQTISATLSAPLASGEIAYGSLDGGATWTDITGKISGTTLHWDSATLSGNGTLKLKVVDAFGHEGPATSHAYVLDTVAPDAPTVISVDASSSTPILTGTASLGTGEALTVTVNGATYHVVPNGGSWSLDLASASPVTGSLSLAAGTSYTVQAVVSDAAGNTRDASGTLTISAPPPRVADIPDVQTSFNQQDISPLASSQLFSNEMSPSPLSRAISFLSPATASNLLNSVSANDSIGAATSPLFDSGNAGSHHFDGLVLDRGIADQTVVGTETTEISIPTDTFAYSPDATIRLAARQANGSPLPSWISFDALKGKFTVHPPPGMRGEIAIKLVARDSQGHEAATTFKIKVGGNAQKHAALDPHGRPALSEQVRHAANETSGRLNKLSHAAEWLNS